jgi:hypothetical protein
MNRSIGKGLMPQPLQLVRDFKFDGGWTMRNLSLLTVAALGLAFIAATPDKPNLAGHGR